MPIRVLQVIGKMDRGGAETMVMNLYRNINREKVQYDFLVHTRDEGAYDKEIRKLGGNIYYVQRFKGFNSISYYKECNAFFKKHKEISIVHGHIGSCASLYLKAAKKNGCFTIAHSHNAINRLSNPHDFFFQVFSFPTRYIADQLIGCSTEAGISRYGKKQVRGRRYRNFTNGIDLDKFTINKSARDRVRAEFKIGKDEIVVGTVGRFTEQKNPEFILAIFEQLVQTKSDVKCIWVGKGELFEDIREKVLEKHLEKSIILTGVREDIPDILQSMDCFLFPSKWEGLPVTIIEAQAAGLRIVLSDVISHEVEITDLLTWCNLDDTPENWADICLRVAVDNQSKRYNPFDALRSQGYDVKETAQCLQEFYLKNSKEKHINA